MRRGPRDFDISPADYSEPAQLAGFRRPRMRGVEPGPPVFDDPGAFRGNRRIARHHHAAALARGGRAIPADQKAILAFGEMRDLVEGFQVVRAALIFFLVVLMRDRAEFELVVLRQAPHLVVRPIAGAAAELAMYFVHQAFDLRELPPEDDRLAMFFDREAAKQRGFSPARPASIENLVGLAEIGFGLRSQIGGEVTLPRSLQRFRLDFPPVVFGHGVEPSENFV